MANPTQRQIQDETVRAWQEARSCLQALAASESAPAGGFVTGAIIGPHVESRPMERTTDLDLLLITRKDPSVEFIDCLHRLFARLQDRSSQHLDVQYALKDGPMKPPAHDRPVLFFHVLLHSVPSYCQSPLTLVKRSWQMEARPFIGVGPGRIERLLPVSRDELLCSAIGVSECHRLLQALRTPYLEWATQDRSAAPVMRLNSLPVTDDLSIVETAIYCVLRCASNACRWLLGRTTGIGILANAIDTFEALFGASGWASIPRDAYIAKRQIRSGQVTASPQLAALWQSRALAFLDALHSCVESIPREHHTCRHHARARSGVPQGAPP